MESRREHARDETVIAHPDHEQPTAPAGTSADLVQGNAVGEPGRLYSQFDDLRSGCLHGLDARLDVARSTREIVHREDEAFAPRPGEEPAEASAELDVDVLRA